MVSKKVVPGANIEETIQRCLILYEDKLRDVLNSENDASRGWTRKVLELEESIAKLSEEALPLQFKEKGYSRLRAVYAFPFKFPESWCYPNLVPIKNSFAKEETVITMIVDGSSSLVVPMQEIDMVYNHNYPSNRQKNINRIKKYWESAVSLEEFTNEFERPSRREYIWCSKNGKKRIEKPEVLIPEWALEKISFLNTSENRV